MRRTAWLAIVVLLAGISFGAAKKSSEDGGGSDGKFTDHLSSAVALAKENHRLILLDFTGSDWCGFCIKLKEEVFDKDEFKKYASENLQLVEVDFPDKKVLPKDVKEQNEKLKQKYEPRGYPTIVFVKADGTEVGRLVGFGGDAKDWQKQADAIVKKNTEK